MRSSKKFIKDGLLLTATALILKSAGVFFSARLSILAGNAVMGLYTQIMTVYSFAVTAAAAGINLGATRIIAETCGQGEEQRISCAMRSCVRYCLTAGIIVAVLLFAFAPLLGNAVLSDTRTVRPLRALSFALPFIALSNAFHGYFNGVKQIQKSAFTSLFEQFSRIISTIYALNAFQNADAEVLCLVLVICNAASEAISFFILYFFYSTSKRSLPKQLRTPMYKKREFIAITLPIAVSSLIRSLLTTTEHILIPIGLRASGLNYEDSLAQYGVVSGMVLPILLYPMALLSSFASITVSELSCRVSAGESMDKIRQTVTKGLSFAIIYGIACSALIGCFSVQLGNAIYKNTEAGTFLKITAPLVFFMYLDHISDGMLKGLNKQNYVMKVNIFDAAMSVIFAIILIPRFGIYGFIASLYLCECLNCFFSFGKVFLFIAPKLSIIKNFVIPTAAVFIAVHLSFKSSAYFGNFITSIILATAVYIIILKICGVLNVFKTPTHEST